MVANRAVLLDAEEVDCYYQNSIVTENHITQARDEKMSNVHGLYSNDSGSDDENNRFVGGIGAQGGGR